MKRTPETLENRTEGEPEPKKCFWMFPSGEEDTFFILVKMTDFANFLKDFRGPDPLRKNLFRIDGSVYKLVEEITNFYAKKRVIGNEVIPDEVKEMVVSDVVVYKVHKETN